MNQGGQGDATASIVHQPERTTVKRRAVQRVAPAVESHVVPRRRRLYFEKHHSDSFDVNPATGAVVQSRPRIPDGATYTQGGVFAQTTFNVTPETVVLSGAVRAGFNRYAAHAGRCAHRQQPPPVAR